MSTFEPYQIMRDPVQQFCEKNFPSIKSYMDEVSQHLPPPTRCSIEGKYTNCPVILSYSFSAFSVLMLSAHLHTLAHTPTHTSHTVSNEFAERRKKVAKLHFSCQIRGPHCLYSKTCFTMRTRNPKTWIHMIFLDFQVRHFVSSCHTFLPIGVVTTKGLPLQVKEKSVLSTREPGISNLKNIWQILKCENRSFTELVTSQFPQVKVGYPPNP